MTEVKKSKKKKIILAIIVIALVGIIFGSIIIRNTIINQDAEEESRLAGANQNSELIANNIKKGVTIGGITGTLESLDTSDATATVQDILSGKTAYVNGNKITGTLSPGSKVATGTVRSTSGSVDVNCGFQVTYVMLYSGSTDEISQIIYNNGQGYGSFTSRYQSGYVAIEDVNNFITPLTNGFRLTSDEGYRFPVVPAYETYTYVAIG